MKWYKHITDSLDDPFIFCLMEEFRSDGYLVFFGVLEIYAREFRTEDEWKLTEKSSYFRHKLLISQSRFKKILSKIHKWEVSFSGEYVTIFIPKFKELLDESTLKKLRDKEKSFRNDSGSIPKSEGTDRDLDRDTDKDKDKNTPLTPRKRVAAYSDSFLVFWQAYPKKVGKDAAWRAWKKRNGEMPGIDALMKAIEEQRRSDQWTKDIQFVPNPATWINEGRWADEPQQAPQGISEKTRQTIEAGKRWLKKHEESRSISGEHGDPE